MPKELEPYRHVFYKKVFIYFNVLFLLSTILENSKLARRKFWKLVNKLRQAKKNTSMYEFSTPSPPFENIGIRSYICSQTRCSQTRRKRFPAFPLKIKMENVMEPLNKYLSRQNERKKKRLPFAYVPVFRQSFIVSGTVNGVDICFVSPNLFWVVTISF